MGVINQKRKCEREGRGGTARKRNGDEPERSVNGLTPQNCKSERTRRKRNRVRAALTGGKENGDMRENK